LDFESVLEEDFVDKKDLKYLDEETVLEYFLDMNSLNEYVLLICLIEEMDIDIMSFEYLVEV
jgi:hypothetical protein